MLLSVENLRKTFSGTPVLHGIDLEVEKGDVVAIIGPSGSGKTTLLRCLNFLEKADGGRMTFAGETGNDLPQKHSEYPQAHGFRVSELQPLSEQDGA